MVKAGESTSPIVNGGPGYRKHNGFLNQSRHQNTSSSSSDRVMEFRIPVKCRTILIAVNTVLFVLLVTRYKVEQPRMVAFSDRLKSPEKIHTQEEKEILIRNSSLEYWNRNMLHYHNRLLQCASLDITTEKELSDVRERTKEVFTPRNITFLEQYRNPCWFEEQNSPILHLKANGFFFQLLLMQVRRREIDTLQISWYERYLDGERQRLRCLPYFYLAGVTKCGTSDLFDKLLLHPYVKASLVGKEAQWWNRRALGMWTYPQTHFSMDEYIGLFDKVAVDIQNTQLRNYHPVITGDGSPSTLWNMDRWMLYPGNENSTEPQIMVANLIHSFTPQARIIIMLRNPVDRLYSHYFHNLRRAEMEGSKGDFHDIVTRDMARLEQCMLQRSTRECVYNPCINGDVDYDRVTLRAGLYHVFINDWLQVFPKRQVKIVRFEDYKADGALVINEVLGFLGVGRLPNTIGLEAFEAPVRNQRDKLYMGIGDMLPATRRLLEEFYAPSNRELVTLLNDTRFDWN